MSVSVFIWSRSKSLCPFTRSVNTVEACGSCSHPLLKSPWPFFHLLSQVIWTNKWLKFIRWRRSNSPTSKQSVHTVATSLLVPSYLSDQIFVPFQWHLTQTHSLWCTPCWLTHKKTIRIMIELSHILLTVSVTAHSVSIMETSLHVTSAICLWFLWMCFNQQRSTEE